VGVVFVVVDGGCGEECVRGLGVMEQRVGQEGEEATQAES